MNTFGDIFRVTIWGESHGESIGVSLDGVPAGIKLCAEDFAHDILRRKSGKKGTTPRLEGDEPHIISGVFNGHTTGAPLTITFENKNCQSSDYSNLVKHPRPSHADLVAYERSSGWCDYRGGGHFSGRLTLPIVAAGVVAKRILGEAYNFKSDLCEVGGEVDKSKFEEVIEQAIAAKDSVGGIVEVVVEGCAKHLGEPFFNSTESKIAHILFSIPAVKGVEFGAGFSAGRARGSANNDLIINKLGETKTNHDGGINGGLTNGNPLVVRAAIKPTPSIGCEQMSYNFETGSVEPLTIAGRHDACIAIRAQVVAEAATAIALADLTLCRR